MTLIIRLYRGVVDHFPIRWTEWVMLWPTFGLWLTLQYDPNTFDKSAAFFRLSQWADEGTWGIIFGCAMVARLVALTVNGTFQGFGLSPHIRGAASLLGALIWSQASLGILFAALENNGPLYTFILATLPVALELINTGRSFRDIGREYPIGE